MKDIFSTYVSFEEFELLVWKALDVHGCDESTYSDVKHMIKPLYNLLNGQVPVQTEYRR